VNQPYAISYEPLFRTLELMDLAALVDQPHPAWWNQTLIQVDGTAVRLGVFEGEYHWHRHEKEDEFFLVLAGRIEIELEGSEPVVLEPLQAFCVPAGRPHRPVARVRSAVLMLERVGIVATGD